MKFFLFSLLLLSSVAEAYVPTVESLLRNGSNPEVSANGISLTLTVKRLSPSGEKESSLFEEKKSEEYYKIFLTKVGAENLKIAQSRYKDATFSDLSLQHRTYFSNFSPYTLKPTIEQAERGIFYALLHSMTLNNGSHMVNYLKALGVPVKLNGEIINREKVELLADYKKYLATINQNRAARKTEVNPLRPDDASARSRAEGIMSDPMYNDLKQVTLGRDQGAMAWLVNAGAFEGVFSYRDRFAQKIKFKSAAGDFEIICKDYWLANGTHSFPKTLLIKTFSGENFQVDITTLRHYVEKEDDIQKRLKRWDSILKGKESTDPRPEFLL